MKNDKFIPFDIFITRSPLFPYSYTREREKWVDSPEFQEALFIASPDLYNNKEETWGEDKDLKKDTAVLKYFLRACVRCTPFGAFAGCSSGKIGEKTEIELEPTDKFRRSTRLDMQYVCALIQKLEQDTEFRKKLKFFPNDSIYQLGGKIRYIEYHYKGTKRLHQVASIESSEYVDVILDKAITGGTIHELASSIVEEDITLEDAMAFIEEMIDAQLLKSELDPAVVGKDALTDLIEKLERIGHDELLPKLYSIRDLLAEIDSSPLGTTIGSYEKITDIIKTIGVKYEPKFLFQTDMFQPAKVSTVSAELLEELAEAMCFLYSNAREWKNGNMDSFVEAFRKRYEDAEVPLTDVLDNELGIGYPKSSGAKDLNVLIDNLNIPRRAGTSTPSYTPNDVKLLKLFVDAYKNGSEVIELNDENFKGNNRAPMPETIAVMCKVISDSPGNRLIHFKSAGGACGGNLLGRFCHTDPSIQELVQKISDREKEKSPDVIFAEFSHLPESRIGNIASRPVFRDYVLRYLSNSDVELEKQITISDLMISIKGSKINIRSKKHNKEVIPRLTCAHNFSNSPIPIYRFLCDIQTQLPIRGLGLSWGELFNNFNYLPRLQYKNIILQRQRWKISKDEVKDSFKMKDEELAGFFAELVKKRNLPRYVTIAEADNEMLVDFEDTECLKILVSLIRKRPGFELHEFLLDEEQCVIKRDGRGFTNEMVFVYHQK